MRVYQKFENLSIQAEKSPLPIIDNSQNSESVLKKEIEIIEEQVQQEEESKQLVNLESEKEAEKIIMDLPEDDIGEFNNGQYQSNE